MSCCASKTGATGADDSTPSIDMPTSSHQPSAHETTGPTDQSIGVPSSDNTGTSACDAETGRKKGSSGGPGTSIASEDLRCAGGAADCCKSIEGYSCDEECALAYAKYDFSVSSASCCSADQDPGDAVSVHLQAALAKYTAMLRKAICLCKSVSSSPAVKCCAKKSEKISTRSKEGNCPGEDVTNATYLGQCNGSQASYKDARGMPATSPPSASTAKTTALYQRNEERAAWSSTSRSMSSCCQVSAAETSPSHFSTAVSCRTSSGCCRADERKEKASASPSTAKPCAAASLCESSSDRCNLDDQSQCDQSSRHAAGPAAEQAHNDLERGTKIEEVCVSVQGMTCTSCENKLVRVLDSIAGVSSVRVTFVSGRADFKLDTATTTENLVIEQAQQSTGFTLRRMRLQVHFLDLLVPPGFSRTLLSVPLEGVDTVDETGKRSCRVSYNPHTVGARSLLESLGNDVRLAPATKNDKMNAELRVLIDLGIKTAIAVLFTIPVCVLAWADTGVSKRLAGILMLIFATFVQFTAIAEFYTKAFRSLFSNGVVELDMLVVISITAAYVYSVTAFVFLMAGHPLAVEEFFETSTLLISLVLFGRLLAGYARLKAIATISAGSLQEPKVTLIDPGSGVVRQIDARLVQFGDIFQVSSHARIATDGIVIDGISDVDESMLTGESALIAKKPGSRIVAGTLNGEGVLKAKVERLPGQNTISEISNMVEEAQASKPRIQDLADRIAGYFIPVVLALALLTFVTWILVGYYARREGAGSSFASAITYTIAVLAVSCPCGLGLAVPMVIVITGGVAARRGVIVKSASVLERAWSATDVVFDKTGTLTTGEMKVEGVKVLRQVRGVTAYSLSLALCITSDHPVSRAISSFIGNMDVCAAAVTDSKSLPGQGLEAELEGQRIRGGSPYWLNVQDEPEVRSLLSSGLALFCVSVESSVVAIFSLSSSIRPEAPTIIKRLQSKGLKMHILSGDVESSVESIAHALNIPNTRSRQSPADKAEYIRQLDMDSKTRTVFIGDGTNDAVAVAQATIGICMGTTSDVTGSSADVVLLGGLDGVLDLLGLSKAVYRRIIFNFVWACVYNVVAILFAAGAFVTIRLPPAYAGLGEMVSVIPVILVALSMMLVSGR